MTTNVIYDSSNVSVFLLLHPIQISNSSPIVDIKHLSYPEDSIELINLDCNNEDNPSSVRCRGKWFYWKKSEGFWREDSSVRLACRGIKIKKL